MSKCLASDSAISSGHPPQLLGGQKGQPHDTLDGRDERGEGEGGGEREEGGEGRDGEGVEENKRVLCLTPEFIGFVGDVAGRVEASVHIPAAHAYPSISVGIGNLYRDRNRFSSVGCGALTGTSSPSHGQHAPHHEVLGPTLLE